MIIEKYKDPVLNTYFWRIDFTLAGRHIRRRGFISKSDAEKFITAKRNERLQREAGVLPKTTIRVTVKELIDARIRSLGSSSQGRRHSANVLRSWLAMIDKNLDVQEITTADVALFRDKRIKDGVAPQTIFREISDIMSALNSAAETFPSLEDWRAPRRPKLKVPKGSRSRVISADEASRILAYLRRPREKDELRYSRKYRSRINLADYFQIALQTGLRAGEIRLLRWTDINFHWKKLRAYDYKNDREAVIEIPDSLVLMLRARLENQKKTRESEYVFPSDQKENAPLTYLNRSVLRSAAKALGIPWGYDTPGGIVFHTTRHTAVTAMLDSGADLPTVQSQSRHTDRTMLLRYGHATTRSRRDAVKALDQFAPEPEEERKACNG